MTQCKMCTHARKQTSEDATDHQEGKVGEDAGRLCDKICDAKLCQIVRDGSHTAGEEQKMFHKQKVDKPDYEKAQHTSTEAVHHAHQAPKEKA